MKITVLCNDTRGGVQPYAALATGLVRAGHSVRAVAPVNLCHLFAPSGLEALPLPMTENAEDFSAAGIAEKGTLAAMRLMRAELPRVMQAWSRFTLEAILGADLVTGGIGGMAIGLAAAERAGIPFLPAHLQPVQHPTDRYPGVLTSGLPGIAGPWARRISHRVSDAAMWLPFRAAMTAARRDFGLTGRLADPTTGQMRLYGFSRLVVPMPEDDTHRATGYWTVGSGDWTPSADLAAFLSAGAPVVSIGFGSMGSSDAAALHALVAKAARIARVRVVLIGLQALPPTEAVHPIKAVPHEWLFARMNGIVHHGGAGTTGAALRAGRPQLVVPFAVDQPFWGRRVMALGAGPPMIPRRRLTSQGLADALRTLVADTGLAEKAASLGANLRSEDGVANAVAGFRHRSWRMSRSIERPLKSQMPLRPPKV